MSEVFGGGSPSTEEPTKDQVAKPATDQAADPYKDLLSTIVAEDGRVKYNSVEDALKSVSHSERTIRELRQEREELARAAAKAEALEAIVSKLSAPPEPTTVRPTDGAAPQAGVDESKVLELVRATLAAEKSGAIKEENERKVREELTARLGDKALQVYTARATALGMSVAQLDELSATSPGAVIALFTDVAAPDPTKPTPSSGSTVPPPTPAAKGPSVFGSSRQVDPVWERLKTELGYNTK